MDDAHAPEARPPRRLKPVIWLCVSLVALLAILIATLLCLPYIVSSERFRALAEAKASQTLKRPVHIGGLRWTWSEGISVHSLRIDDDPAFSMEPLLQMRNLSLKISPGDLLRRRLDADFGIEGLDVRFIRNRDGVTNVDVLLSAFDRGVPKKPEPGKTFDEWRRSSFSLPFEVRGRADLREMSLRVEDRSQGRTITFGGASLAVEVSSLEQRSLLLRVASEIDLDGAPLPPLRLEAEARSLFTPKGEFSLRDASIVADGTLPGMTMDVKCDFRTPEISNTVRIELAELMKIVVPFLPPPLSDTVVTGKLGLAMNGSGDPMKNLKFTLSFTGQDIGISGGLLKKNSMGPMRFSVTSEGEADLNNVKVTVEKGEVRFLERSVLSWRGSVKEAGGRQVTADVTVGPLSVDLGEVYRTTQPLLPEVDGLNLGGLSRAQALTAGEIRLSGTIPKGDLTIALENLLLRVPATDLKQRDMAVSLGESSVSVSKLTLILKDLFPSQATATMSLHTEGLRVSGPQEVIVKQMDIPSFSISASDIRMEKDALFGVSAHIALSGTQSLGSLSVPGTAAIGDLKESLSAEAFLRPSKSVEVELRELKAYSPSVSIGKGTPVIETALSVSTALSMVLRKGKDYEGDIKRLFSDISVGTMASVVMDLTAERWGFGGLGADVRAKMDLSQMMRYVPPDIARDLKLSGSADMRWILTGRLPGEREMEEMKEPEKALATIRDSDIVRNLDLALALNAPSFQFTTAEGQRLTVSGLSTVKPLKMVMEGGLKKAGLSGAVSASVRELPHLGELKRPLEVTLDVSAGEEMLKTLSVTQSSRVSPLDLKQDARLSVSGLDRLLSKGAKGPPGRFLEFIGAKASFSLDLGTKGASRLKEDVLVSGRIAAGADIDLLAGRGIGFEGWMRTPGLEVTYGKLMEIRDLRSNLAVAKRYNLSITEGQGAAASPLPYLSVQVLRPATEALRQAGAEGQVAARLTDDARPNIPGSRSFSVESIHVGTKPVPVDMTHAGVDFSLKEGLPSIDFFQADVLGGTVRGSLSLKRRKGDFFAGLNAAFSGLDAKRLIAGRSPSGGDGEAELSGLLSVALPLSTSLDRLLQDVEAEVEITHIGADTLDRILFSLDPYENNESIVGQRKLLRMGRPIWARATVKNGLFSASGEVEVKGVRIELPKLERLNVSGLPGLGRFAERLAVVGPVIKTLDILSADTVEVDRDGKIRLSYKGE